MYAMTQTCIVNKTQHHVHHSKRLSAMFYCLVLALKTRKLLSIPEDDHSYLKHVQFLSDRLEC